MFRASCMILIIAVLLQWRLSDSAPAEMGKPTEKVRAYEFGFSIEENQHRHEKRDENGIVMGEFGFITADGIYHVTVYATDEDGKFKILAMRSYPYSNPEKKFTTSTAPAVQRPTIIKAQPLDIPSCGGCVLTKKLTPKNNVIAGQIPGAQSNVFRTLSKTIGSAGANGVSAGRLPSQQAGASTLQPRPPGITSKLTPQLPSKPFSSQPPKVLGSVPSTLNGKQYQLTNLNPSRPALSLSNGPANRVGKTFVQSAPKELGVRFGAPNIDPSSTKSNPSTPRNLAFSSAKQSPRLHQSPANSNRNVPPQQHLPQQNTLRPNTASTTATLPNAKETHLRLPQQLITQNKAQSLPVQNTLLQSTANIKSQPARINTSLQPQLTGGIPSTLASNTIPPLDLTPSKLAGKVDSVRTSPELIKPQSLPVLSPTTNNIELTKQPFTSKPLSSIPTSQIAAKSTPPIPNGVTVSIQIRPTTRAHPQNNIGAQTPTTAGKLTPSTKSIGKITPTGNGGGPLYRFNYVLDYNSHREEGRIDGSKEGNYQTIGEDGIRRIIDYIANENGYQPHIKWERVPSNQLPTGENKLKEYEFVWFNLP